jgi:alanyl-tRNA synthetase
VQQVADGLEEQLASLEKLKHGEERDIKFKTLNDTLLKTSISAISKAKFKARIAAVGKSIVDAQKAAAKEENKKVIDQITKHFDDAPESKTYVSKLEGLSPGSKALNEALKHVGAKLKDKAVYLFASDEASGKIMHGAAVGDALQKSGLAATEWTGAVSKVLGGKAGGKVSSAISMYRRMSI